MRRLVFVTQEVDPAHPFLAATVPKIEALAARFDEVAVLAASAAPGVLPENCRVVVHGAASRVERGARYARALEHELRRRPAAVVVHMVPLLAVLAAPLVRPRRVPLLLWFNHWKGSRTLALAERLSTAVLTVERRSFPLPTRKLVPIGHGQLRSLFSVAGSATQGTAHPVADAHTAADQYRATGLSASGLPVSPGSKFLLGTDDLGRDIMVRLAYGARISLYVGVIATLATVAIGAILGLAAGAILALIL